MFYSPICPQILSFWQKIIILCLVAPRTKLIQTINLGRKKKIRKISGTWKLHGTFHWNQKSGRTWKIYQISLFVIPHHSKMFAQRSKAMTQKSDFNISILVMAKTESVCSNKSNSKYFTYSIVTSVQNMTFSHSFKKYHKTT